MRTFARHGTAWHDTARHSTLQLQAVHGPRDFSNSPEQMALYAVLVGILSVIVGLQSSLTLDTPAGPSIVAALLLLFIVSTLSMPKIRSIKRKYSNNASHGAMS